MGKDRWEKIEERGSLIYMIVKIATGKVYCGEMEQSYGVRTVADGTTMCVQ